VSSQPFTLRKVAGRAVGVEKQVLKIRFAEFGRRDRLRRSTPHEADTICQCEAEQLTASLRCNMAESSRSLEPQYRGRAAERDTQGIWKK